MGESVFVKCHCCCSVIEFEEDDWEIDSLMIKSFEDFPFFNVSIWRENGRRPLTKKERKRWCDHIMKTGDPWADHTILTAQDAQRIAKFILQKLEDYDKKKKQIGIDNRYPNRKSCGSNISKQSRSRLVSKTRKKNKVRCNKR